MGWEFAVGRCKPSHLGHINNKVLCIAQDLCLISWISHNGKEYFEKGMYMCVKLNSSCSTAEIGATL